MPHVKNFSNDKFLTKMKKKAYGNQKPLIYNKNDDKPDLHYRKNEINQNG